MAAKVPIHLLACRLAGETHWFTLEATGKVLLIVIFPFMFFFEHEWSTVIHVAFTGKGKRIFPCLREMPVVQSWI
jgi:hypothetical protein